MALLDCGIVVPVRNEALVLDETVPALLAATRCMRARIIWVCNGCTDDSVERIRHHAGSAAEIIIREVPGKTGALQAGDEALGALFPRLYLDADACLGPGDLASLMIPLITGAAEMTGARYDFDTAATTCISEGMAMCWLALPHAKEGCFVGAIGVSSSGRSRWREWPDVTGDDIFAVSMVPPARRMIVRDALVTTRPPPDFVSWIKTRRRWIEGERQLRKFGLEPPRSDKQRVALLTQMVTPRTMLGAWAFATARLLAAVAARNETTEWLPSRK